MRIQVIRETHEAAESVVRRLRAAGGINWYGEPMYRAVWGWNRLAWMGGWMKEVDSSGGTERERFTVQLEPKYAAVNRWHIEKWMPAETFGSPLAWYAQTAEYASDREGWRRQGGRVEALGPYPSRGEYEHCLTLEGAAGEFLQLTPTVAERVARAIEFSRGVPRARRKAFDARQREKKDEDWEKFAWDVLDDAVPAFHKQPFVTVG